MVNVYVFRTDTTTPSGWTDVSSTYSGRFLLGNGTALSTGGATQHTHALTGWSCSTYNMDRIRAYTYDSVAGNHNHAQGSYTISTVDHLPSYKDFRILRRDVSGWNNVIPSGSVVFSETIPQNWERLDNGSSYYLRISSTAGGTGGSPTHTHTISGTTGGPSATNGAYNWNDDYGASSTHTHAYNITTNTGSNEFYYWSCGLARATADTKIRKGFILLFDATPNSTDWTVLTGANDRYLRVSSSNSIATGGSNCTHNHSASGNTGSCGTIGLGKGSGVIGQCNNHVHAISATFDSQTPTLSYVRLIVAQAAHEYGSRAVYVITC